MTCSDPDDVKKTTDGTSSWSGDEGKGSDPLPGKARRTLDEIADALGVAVAVLKEGDGETVRSAGSTASLAETAALVQAFVHIEDPAVRRSLLARARDAATRA